MASSGIPCFTALVSVLFVTGFLALQGAVLCAGAADTLTVDWPLSGSERPLVSKRGKFALGFFQPDNSQHWYMGIWYNHISKQTPVWVANRNSPITNPELSQLTISTDGNMVLLDHSRSAVWSTNMTSISTNSTVAVILDTGNLVLAEASNTSIVLWQSFDHFGDTWLPGGKLGRSKLTGVSTSLVAWKAYNDPSPGVFSLEMDTKGMKQYLLKWKNTQQYWASGNWTGRTFTAVPEMTTTNPMYTFDYMDDENENYFVYDTTDDTIITRLVLDAMGQIKFLTWLEGTNEWTLFWSEPKAQCDVYSLCGLFSVCTENALASCSCLRGFSEQYQGNWLQGDHTAGCTRNVPLQQSNSNGSQNDRFYIMANVKLPSNAKNMIAAGSTQECELACLSNRSCTAYSFNGSCSLWYGDLINLQDLSRNGIAGDTILIRLAASELSDRKHTKRSFIIGITVGGLIVISSAVTILYFLHRRRAIYTHQGDGHLINFKYSDLRFLTRNFSDRLGAGSFGSVFKGVLLDTTTVGVKKLEGFRQGEKQFRAEVSTIGNIQHINLIRLLGFCSEGAKRLLVYEYMPNGSLDQHLFGSRPLNLSWKTRYQIAIGIAKGLAYLHEECRDCIIHCDIKPENILLDMSFIPKVADFGMAKLLDRDFSRVLTSLRGTLGYLAPEWISGEAITAKADVFSYGMMLFEIISGKRNVKHTETSKYTFFPVLVARKLLEEEVQTLLDCELVDDVNLEELERACKVACWCVQDNESSRPTMGEIVQILEGLVAVEMPPAPRYLQVLAEGVEHVSI